MIETFIRGLLGPSLAPLLDFLETHPALVAAFLFVLVGLYVAGRVQLNNISNKTKTYVLNKYQEVIQRRPKITAAGLYKLIYPEWAEEVKTWGWFIPHRLDLWPVPVNAENVKSKITFDAKWVADILQKNKIELISEEETQNS